MNPVDENVLQVKYFWIMSWCPCEVPRDISLWSSTRHHREGQRDMSLWRSGRHYHKKQLSGRYNISSQEVFQRWCEYTNILMQPMLVIHCHLLKYTCWYTGFNLLFYTSWHLHLLFSSKLYIRQWKRKTHVEKGISDTQPWNMHTFKTHVLCFGLHLT